MGPVGLTLFLLNTKIIQVNHNNYHHLTLKMYYYTDDLTSNFNNNIGVIKNVKLTISPCVAYFTITSCSL